MSPLNQFQNMPKEPKLGDSFKKQQDNENYQNKTIDLRDAKSKLLADLGYKPFNSETKSSEKQEKTQKPLDSENVEKPESNTENGSELEESKLEKNPKGEQEKNDKTKETPEITSDSPYFPTLKRLKESGTLEEDAFSKLVEDINKVGLEEGKAIFVSYVGSIQDENVKESILKSFDNKAEEITEENFENTEFFQNAKGIIDISEGVGGLETMLAKNYISIPEDSEQNTTKDLSLAMDTTLNTIITKNSPDFKQQNGELIGRIKTETSLNSKYNLLKELYKNDLIQDAKLGGKRAKQEINSKKKSLTLKAKQLTNDIKEAKSIKNSQEREKRLQELQKIKEQIIQEGQAIDGFEKEINDIESLGGGEEDKTPNTPSQKEENK